MRGITDTLPLDMVWEFATVLVFSAGKAAVRWQWRRTDGRSRAAHTFLTYRDAYRDAVQHGLQPDHACIVASGGRRTRCEPHEDHSPSS